MKHPWLSFGNTRQLQSASQVLVRPPAEFFCGSCQECIPSDIFGILLDGTPMLRSDLTNVRRIVPLPHEELELVPWILFRALS